MAWKGSYKFLTFICSFHFSIQSNVKNHMFIFMVMKQTTFYNSYNKMIKCLYEILSSFITHTGNICRVIFGSLRVMFNQKFRPRRSFWVSSFLGQNWVSWVTHKLDVIVSVWICTSSNEVDTLETIGRMYISEMILKIIYFILIEVNGGNGSRMSARREQPSEQW